MISQNSVTIPVLMYHAIEDTDHPAGTKNLGEQLYVLNRDKFYAQMRYLAQNGFTVLLLSELARLQEWPPKSIVLTFDDGHQSNCTLALPILKEFGFKAHFFITTNWINTPHFLTPSQIKTLASHGMEIGSHGVTHSYFNDLSNEKIQEELLQSKFTLEIHSQKKITSFSAPGGRIQTKTIRIGKSTGYNLFCTSKFAQLSQTLLLSATIPRLAVKANTDTVNFKKMVHGDKQFMLINKTKITFMTYLKNILGNTKYEKIRQLILAHRGN